MIDTSGVCKAQDSADLKIDSDCPLETGSDIPGSNKNEEKMDVDKQPKLKEPSTPKALLSSLMGNFEFLNSRQLTPSRKAAIEAKRVAKYTSEIERAMSTKLRATNLNDDGSLAGEDQSSGVYRGDKENPKSTDAPEIHRNKPYVRPAAPIRDIGQFTVPSLPGSPASPAIMKSCILPSSPLITEPRTPESIGRALRTGRMPRTPYSDPNSVTDTLYTSVYNPPPTKSDTAQNSPSSALGGAIDLPISVAGSSPDPRASGRRYHMGPLKRIKDGVKLRVFTEPKKDHRLSLMDINAIPDTLLPVPLSKNVLSVKRSSSTISLPAFPQLIEVNDAPPTPCYEDYVAKSAAFRKRKAQFDNICRRKKVARSHSGIFRFIKCGLLAN